MPGARGSILIVALWSVSLLTVFAVILGAQTRYKMTLASRLNGKAELRSVAEAGVKTAIAVLKKETDGNVYDSMMDGWSDNPQALKDVNTPSGTFTVSCDYAYDRSKPPQTMYGLIDEERKMNINKSDLKNLRHLIIMALGMDEQKAQDIAASIIDWRDADEGLSLPVGSAESSYYRGLTYPYEAKNGDFEVLDELLLVKGVDHNVFERLKDYVTVFGTGKINVNTASREVLMAAGLGHNIVDDILEIRMGIDKVAGTEDDGFFDSASNIVTGLGRFKNLSEADILMLTAASEQYLTVNSSAFTIHSAAASKNGRDVAVTTAVADKKGKVLCWKES